LIDFSFQRRKQALPPKADKRKKQNTKLRTQNSEDSKHKNQNHNKIHSAKGGKMLLNRLFELGLLDLKPCPAGRFVVPKGLAGILTYFRGKVNENLIADYAD
jgi:hypothetical protein